MRRCRLLRSYEAHLTGRAVDAHMHALVLQNIRICNVERCALDRCDERLVLDAHHNKFIAGDNLGTVFTDTAR